MMRVVLAAFDELTVAQQEAIGSIRITDAQVEFSGTVARALTLCREQSGTDLCGVALLQDQRPIGFMVVRRRATLPAWAPSGAAVVGGLQVDVAYQGQGLGLDALCQLPDWLRARWPEIERIVLRVDDSNHAGIRAYEKAGWQESGPRTHGRVGLERTMVRWLVEQPTADSLDEHTV
jgi:RimJ/RimL family protein N-acetyltransferase